MNPFSLIADHRDKVLFCTPQTCYREVAFHLPNIARKRHISPAQEQEAWDTLNNLKQPNLRARRSQISRRSDRTFCQNSDRGDTMLINLCGDLGAKIGTR